MVMIPIALTLYVYIVINAHDEVGDDKKTITIPAPSKWREQMTWDKKIYT